MSHRRFLTADFFSRISFHGFLIADFSQRISYRGFLRAYFLSQFLQCRVSPASFLPRTSHCGFLIADVLCQEQLQLRRPEEPPGLWDEHRVREAHPGHPSRQSGDFSTILLSFFLILSISPPPPISRLLHSK
jgi:hypothetical protein